MTAPEWTVITCEDGDGRSYRASFLTPITDDQLALVADDIRHFRRLRPWLKPGERLFHVPPADDIATSRDQSA